MAYFHFVEELATLAGDASLQPTFDHVIKSLLKGQADAQKPYGNDVKFISWKNPAEVPAILRQCIEQEIAHSHCKSGNMIALFTADLLKQDSTLRELLRNESILEMLTTENLDHPTGKVHYTSALRAKGLEWDAVFLVCSSLTHPKNLFQLFIGASRAKGKVYVIYSV